MNWPTVSLEQIAPPRTSRLQFEPNARVWYLTPDQIQNRTGHIINKRSVRTAEVKRHAYIFDEGNVLYSRFQPRLRKVLCPDEPGIATSLFVPLRPRPDLLNRNYLMYYLRSNCFLNFANTFTDDRARIITAKFLRHRIPVPSLGEQRRIVEVLEQSEELNKKFSEADEKVACVLPALFYKMFGDPIKNSRNWPMKPFAEVTLGNPQHGARAGKSEWTEGLPRYVGIADVTKDGRLTDADEIGLDLDDWDSYSLKPEDFLFARSGAANKNVVGRTYFYQPQDGLCVYDDSLVRFSLDRNQILPLYLFALTQTVYYSNWVRVRKRIDFGREHINDRDYLSLQIPCPPVSSQEIFVEIADQLIGLREKLKVAREKTQQLFDVLLHLAFSGELTAEWRDSHADELKRLEL